MITVWKWDIPWRGGSDEFGLNMPRGARLLSVQRQNGEPRLWAMVDTDEATEIRWFLLAGTNRPVPRPGEMEYIGTVLLLADTLVLHVFEVPTGG